MNFWNLMERAAGASLSCLPHPDNWSQGRLQVCQGGEGRRPKDDGVPTWKLALCGDFSENFLTNMDQKVRERGALVRSPPPYIRHCWKLFQQLFKRDAKCLGHLENWKRGFFVNFLKEFGTRFCNFISNPFKLYSLYT